MQEPIDIQLQEQGIPFGKYRLIAKLAVGGMAELFVARQQGLGGFTKTVAVKCILPYFARDREFISMFLGEARLAAHLNHSNVVQIQDVGDVDGVYFMVMEYIPGQNLKAFAKRLYSIEANRELPPYALIASLFVQALQGLSHVHDATDENQQHLHLVHRDISPNNLMLSYDGNVKIVDFGVAKAKTQESETQVGVLKGRLSYMSPEHLSGQPLDGRSDIFAMGVVLYELTTNRRLFKRRSEAETMQALMTSPIPPPSRLYANYPPGLEALLMKALNRDPNKRFQSAVEMRDALEDWLLEYDQSALGTRHLVSIMDELFPEEKQEERKGNYPKPVTQNDLMNLARGSYRVMEDGSIFTYFAAPGSQDGSASGASVSETAGMMPLVQDQGQPLPEQRPGTTTSPYGAASSGAATAQHRAAPSPEDTLNEYGDDDEPTTPGTFPEQPAQVDASMTETAPEDIPVGRNSPLETASYSLSDDSLEQLERGELPQKPYRGASAIKTSSLPEGPSRVLEMQLEEEEELSTDVKLAAAPDDDEPPTALQPLPPEPDDDEPMALTASSIVGVDELAAEMVPAVVDTRHLAEPEIMAAVPSDVIEGYESGVDYDVYESKGKRKGMLWLLLLLLLCGGGGGAWWFVWGPGASSAVNTAAAEPTALDAGTLAGTSPTARDAGAMPEGALGVADTAALVPDVAAAPSRFVMRRAVIVRRPIRRRPIRRRPTRRRVVRRRYVPRRRFVRRRFVRRRSVPRRMPTSPKKPFSSVKLDKKVKLRVYESRGGARVYTKAHTRLCRKIEREVGRVFGRTSAVRGITKAWQRYVRKRFATSRRKSFVFYPRAAAYVIFRDLQRGKSFSYVANNLVKYQKNYRFSKYKNR